MTGETPMCKGWCPGALRPMMAKDGLLVRLKFSCGILSAVTLRGVAQAGRHYGNGQFDLTTRANLQIRGVREDQLPRLTAALEALGLLDENAAAEAVRNVLMSPLAGLNGSCEAHAAAKALEESLAANQHLYALPAKFAFLIDDGSALSLNAIPADVRFDWAGGSAAYLVSIGGSFRNAVTLSRCEAKNIPDIGVRLARTFLILASQLREPPRRMRGLIESCGAEKIAAAAGLQLLDEVGRAVHERPSPIGLVYHNGKYFFGAAAPFGSFDADMLDGAARAAEIFGIGEIRLTPWRALILPLVRPEDAQILRDYFAAHGFIVDREDARLCVDACGGSPNCARATTDARSDALALMYPARRLQNAGLALQIFGCSKGCGLAQHAPLTLTAHAGLYDLKVSKALSDLGITGANRLTLTDAAAQIEALTREIAPRERLPCP